MKCMAEKLMLNVIGALCILFVLSVPRDVPPAAPTPRRTTAKSPFYTRSSTTFRPDPLCTNSYLGTAPCPFDRNTCAYHSSTVDKAKVDWVLAGGTAGTGPIAHDWQPPGKTNTGELKFIDRNVRISPLFLDKNVILVTKSY